MIQEKRMCNFNRVSTPLKENGWDSALMNPIGCMGSNTSVKNKQTNKQLSVFFLYRYIFIDADYYFNYETLEVVATTSLLTV